MLRSAPAMDFGAVAAVARTPVRDLAVAVEQIPGRGRCDQLAATAMTYPLITGAKQRTILKHRACPPPVTLRSTWIPGLVARDRIPGMARWTHRSVDQRTAPRVAFTTDIASDLPGLCAVEEPHCPPAIAVGLTASPPHRTERLAAATPHTAALAALVASPDETTRIVATGRDDLPAVLASATGRDDLPAVLASATETRR